MSYVHIGVLTHALALRLGAFVWLAIISVIVSALPLGWLPAITIGPLTSTRTVNRVAAVYRLTRYRQCAS